MNSNVSSDRDIKNSGSGDTSNRGLAGADEETRQRVASEGGKASHGGRGEDSSSGSSGGSSGGNSSGGGSSSNR